ncbi:Ni/Fe-hydrogenase 1 b-type cytochrome subunit HyaC2 [Salmonella enterica subsp. enterica serovar Heidelberg str. 670102-3]|nr:Ni/Fe-hydrogenase 1 b-type cytochrome subunit HyaC2 [Salmonella enterica subsp. enterica serovar Heidelberg str. 670102-3]
MFYFWMSVLMVCSGFALYGEGLGTDSWAYQWFGWMIRLTGNDSLRAAFLAPAGHVVHYRLRHCACLYRYP